MESFSLSCRKGKEKDDEPGTDHEDDAIILMKRRISAHPLYQIMLQTHLDCLKVGGIVELEVEENHHTKDMKQPLVHSNPNLGAPTQQSELDQFMEAYCLALGKLKEAMEEPQQNSMAFITNMHLQLKELTGSSRIP